MHFCLTDQYTSQAIVGMLDDPNTNRYEAVKKLIETAGGKLITMYGYPADGPGVLVIFEVSDPEMAAAIAGVAMSGGGIQNIKFTRLLLPEELRNVQEKARKVRGEYKAPGK